MTKKHSINNLIKKYEDKEMDAQVLFKSILLKKAKGFVLEEICEEYALDENDKLKLVKRKISSKEVAPDISAVKALCEFKMLESDEFKNMSFEQLKEERDKLFKLFEQIEDKDKEGWFKWKVDFKRR